MCHFTRGWLEGRSIPTDGSQMLASDNVGVSCDFCHRLVDPIPDAENPVEDVAVHINENAHRAKPFELRCR